MSNLSDNPFHFFESLIEHGGIAKCYESFLQDAEMLDGKFISEDKLEFRYSEVDVNGQLLIFVEAFSQKLNSKFDKAYTHFIQVASKNIGAEKEIKSKKELLHFYLESILYLKSISATGTLKADIAIFWLHKTVKYLTEKYGSIVPAHEIVNQSRIEDFELGYFGFIGGRDSLLIIYDALVQLNLFSGEEVAFNQFRGLIYSENPKELNFKIRLTCNLQEATIIFEGIQRFFYNLTNKSIVESNCFITKQGNDLTENSLYSQRSKIKRNLSKEDRLKEIQDLLGNLEVTKK